MQTAYSHSMDFHFTPLTSICQWAFLFFRDIFRAWMREWRIENGKWRIMVFPSEMISNRARSAHHNSPLSIFNSQLGNTCCQAYHGPAAPYPTPQKTAPRWGAVFYIDLQPGIAVGIDQGIQTAALLAVGARSTRPW